MASSSWILALSGLQAGCGGQGGPGPSYPINIWDWFPLEGERTWRYEASGVDHAIVARSDGVPEEVDSGVEVHELIYEVECLPSASTCEPGELFRTRWSADRHQGVHVHGHTTNAGLVTYDPAVVITPGPAVPGERIVTPVDGETWTSTYFDFRDCLGWGQGGMARDSCAALEVRTTARDGYPLAGVYHTFWELGIVSFRLEGERAVWILVDADPCEPNPDVACPEDPGT